MFTRNIQFFLAAFVASIPCWLLINAISEGMTFSLPIPTFHPQGQLLAAHARISPPEDKEFYPERIRNAEPFDLQAQSGFSVLVRADGSQKVLYEKNSNASLPIASISKLMSAVVARETYVLDHEILVVKEALAEKGDMGALKEGDIFSVKQLLEMALVESSNDAIAAIVLETGEQSFIKRMNEKAGSLGMKKTFFRNATGLDVDARENPGNYSTAKDIVALAIYLQQQYPELLDILFSRVIRLYDWKGEFHHDIISTNELLLDSGIAGIIQAGKTGWTEQARGCLLLITRPPDGNGKIITVVLGSEDRFGETKQLLNWIERAYLWKTF